MSNDYKVGDKVRIITHLNGRISIGTEGIIVKIRYPDGPNGLHEIIYTIGFKDRRCGWKLSPGDKFEPGIAGGSYWNCWEEHFEKIRTYENDIRPLMKEE